MVGFYLTGDFEDKSDDDVEAVIDENQEDSSLKPVLTIDQIKIGDWLVVIYDKVWWIAIVEKKDVENLDVYVKFLHPSESARVKFPTKDDFCWLPLKDVIGVLIDAPVPYGSRFFEIPLKAAKEIALKYRAYL